jgi:hypothetical protein
VGELSNPTGTVVHFILEEGRAFCRAASATLATPLTAGSVVPLAAGTRHGIGRLQHILLPVLACTQAPLEGANYYHTAATPANKSH